MGLAPWPRDRFGRGEEVDGDLACADCWEAAALVGECTDEFAGDLGFFLALEGGAFEGCLDALGETVEAGWEPEATLVLG